jgi:O-glycosyl hydrolase
VRRPLLVAEAGVDPGAWHNKIYDSYAYGLQEARQFQELLRYARPQALIYWQFTDDYGLVRVQPDRTVEPTGRFWLMKQFANLTPDHSDVVATASNQPGVTISAFTRGEAFAVHLLNTGPECTATVTGLPPGTWARVTTTETAGFQEATAAADESPAPLALQLPARSLTTLVRK